FSYVYNTKINILRTKLKVKGYTQSEIDEYLEEYGLSPAQITKKVEEALRETFIKAIEDYKKNPLSYREEIEKISKTENYLQIEELIKATSKNELLSFIENCPLQLRIGLEKRAFEKWSV
ncbi:MAG: hypothetical protein AB1779_01870, partial [Candidatus Thermoplasmatota archaeon]